MHTDRPISCRKRAVQKGLSRNRINYEMESLGANPQIKSGRKFAVRHVLKGGAKTRMRWRMKDFISERMEYLKLRVTEDEKQSANLKVRVCEWTPVGISI